MSNELSQIARALCARFDYDGITTGSIYTTRAFLEDLRRQGYVAGPDTRGDAYWRLR